MYVKGMSLGMWWIDKANLIWVESVTKTERNQGERENQKKAAIKKSQLEKFTCSKIKQKPGGQKSS